MGLPVCCDKLFNTSITNQQRHTHIHTHAKRQSNRKPATTPSRHSSCSPLVRRYSSHSTLALSAHRRRGDPHLSHLLVLVCAGRRHCSRAHRPSRASSEADQVGPEDGAEDADREQPRAHHLRELRRGERGGRARGEREEHGRELLARLSGERRGALMCLSRCRLGRSRGIGKGWHRVCS